MKTIKILAASYMLICLLVACDKSVTGKDGIKYESYQQACRAFYVGKGVETGTFSILRMQIN